MTRHNADDPRIQKLPKWARDLIAHQVREISRLSEHLVIAKGDFPASKVKVPPGIHDDERELFLPEHLSVDFTLSGPRDVVSARIEGDKLRLVGARELILYPEVSNVISMRCSHA